MARLGYRRRMEPDLFALVAEVARSLCDDGLGTIHSRSHKYGTKVWFDADKPPPPHFEAQVMGRRDIDGQKGIAIEIGWHGEARKEQDNELLLQALMEREPRWRKPLGDEAEAGEFFNSTKWRRISEAWLDPDLSEEGVDLEIGSRLADYINALQPMLSDLADQQP